jgi:hypothetical protein
MDPFSSVAKAALRALPIMAAVFVLVAAAGGATGYTFKRLHGFCKEANCTDGGNPMAALIADSAGNLYGTTYAGGAGTYNQAGTVFELAFDGARYTYHVLYNFCSQPACADGNAPLGNLILDTNGNLYGTTEVGGTGSTRWGTVFKLAHDADRTKWTLKTLYSFCSLSDCADGSFVEAGLTYVGQASGALYDGKSPLYGTTAFGGLFGKGTSFMLTRVKGQTARHETIMDDFCSEASCADGSNPQGIIADAHGKIFGVTAHGGMNNDGGVLFEIQPVSYGFYGQTLYNFCSLPNCADGAYPNAAPVFDARGQLIGTTTAGGTGYEGSGVGVVYRFVRKTSTLSVLYNFCSVTNCPDGMTPSGAAVALDANGNIFGTTHNGGMAANCSDATGCGIAWRLHNGNLTVLHNFCSANSCNDGAYPYGGVILDSTGDLFGTTYALGPAGYPSAGGTVFKLSP